MGKWEKKLLGRHLINVHKGVFGNGYISAFQIASN
jgi:hypothetical protein